MGAPEELTHVFIVRFWREPRELETVPPEWRGVVEHVKSGERRFVQHPQDVARAVAAYLGATQPGIFGRLWRFHKQRR